jgi:hypothetical protein
MHSPKLVAAAAVLLAGCPPPQGDLGPYTATHTSGGPTDTSAAATADADATSTDPTGAAPTSSTTAAPTATTILPATTDDPATTTGELDTTGPATTTTAADETTDDTTGDPVHCGDPDPLEPLPEPYVWLEDEAVHGLCVLIAAAPSPDDPTFFRIDLQCEQDMIGIGMFSGPLPNWTALIGQELHVDIDTEPHAGAAPDFQWVALRHGDHLLYGSVLADELIHPGFDLAVYAPLTLDAAFGWCDLMPVADWPPRIGEEFLCELAAPMQLGVRVGLDPKILLKGGLTLEAPVPGGKYKVEVRAMLRGHNCIPGFSPETDVDLYSFAVAFQVDP